MEKLARRVIMKIMLAVVTHCSIIFVIKSENTIRRAAADTYGRGEGLRESLEPLPKMRKTLANAYSRMLQFISI